MAAVGTIIREITITSQGANGDTISTTYQLLGNAEFNIRATVAAGTNTHITGAFATANVQVADITSSTAATLKWNSSGSPAPLMSVGPSQAVHWDVNQYAVDATAFPNPFTVDITAGVFVTNVAETDLNISILLNN